MRRAVAFLTAIVLLTAGPGAALAATTTSKGNSGSGGGSVETSSAASSTAPAVPVTPNGSTNPLSGGVSPVSPTPTPTSTPTASVAPNATATNGGTLSSGSALAIVIGAVVVLGGIAYFIWRDARRRAPVRTAEAGVGGTGRRTGSKAPPKPRKLSAAERKRRKRGRAPRR